MEETAITPEMVVEVEPRELSREEFAQLLEEQCQQELNLSLEQFLAAWDAGELPDTSAVMGIAVLTGRA